MKIPANPVMISELRGRIRGARAMIILTIYLSLTGIITLLIYLAFASSLPFNQNDFEAGRRIGKAIFLTVITAALVQVCIITPSLTAGSIAGEKERQTYDLLITTLLSPWQIAFGKLMSALSFAFLLVLAVLPLAGLAFLFGGVSGIELIIAMIGLIMTAILYATVGLFWSTVMRTTLGATVMAQGMIILSLLGIPFIFSITGVMVSSARGWNDPTESLIFVYSMGTLLSLHPFIALGLTEILLAQGENPFYFTFDSGQLSLLLPSPWLAYTLLALFLTILFLFLSVRMIRPVQYKPARRRRNAERTAVPG